nr:choice-of-anchor Q domain-containing protein [Candidatus Kapabacteria bacterium]
TGEPLITGCTFLNNTAYRSGGAIKNSNNKPFIDKCTFEGNTANEGGCIYNWEGMPSVYNSYFIENTALNGGAIYQYQGDLRIFNSVIFKNSAGSGGAFYCEKSNCYILNCTVYKNYAYNGGAIFSISDDYIDFSFSIRNSIFWGNIAIFEGNQVINRCLYENNYYFYFNNCCISNNENDIVAGNMIQNCIFENPKLALLSNPIHPLSLTSDSPCIDAGTGSGYIEYDIRGLGFPRYLKKNTLELGAVDIGAYEFNYVSDTTQTLENSIIYVNENATGNNDGSNWENAFTNLQSALLEATDSDEIWVAEGTYKPSYDYGLNIGERGMHFRMKIGVAIYGGFPNIGNPSFEERDWEKYSTILSGDIGVENDSSDNCYHIIFNNYYPLLPSNSVLDGFTITNGNANGNNDTNNRGGGISNIRSNPTIRNCTFKKNYGLYGGAVSNWYYSCPIIDNCIFFENYSNHGGAIVNIKSSNAVIKSSTFKKNSAKENGGAINNISSNSLIKYCNFIENSAKGNGGAIYNISILRGTSYINSIFYKNKAKLGGCFFSNSGKINIINSLIFENYAEFGAGLYNLPDALTTIDNSILWSNFTDSNVDTGEQIYLKGGVVNCNFSCIPNNPNDVYGYPSFHYCIEKNPLLIENKDFYFNLSENSPCINKGNNALLPEYILTDIFGNERIYDDIVDIGPFEFQPINVPKLLTPKDSSENITIDSLFTWTAVYSASSYQLQLTSQTPENIIIDTILTQTLFRARELAFSTTYFWKVRAISDSDTSNWSSIWSFTTLSDVHTPWNFPPENKTDLSILCKPNPANENTIIQFDLPFKSSVEIEIYNYCGIELQSIYNGDLETGRYDILYNTGKLQKGIYFVVLRTKDKSSSAKLVIDK